MYRSFSLKELRLVDTPPEAAFDNLTAVASALLAAPVSLVSIVDPENDRQFFKSQFGLPEPWLSTRQTPLAHSFCQHVVRKNAPLVVENAPDHPVVSEVLPIPGLGITAYLGIPVHDPAGTAVGALCVIGAAPREWSQRDVANLREVARCVDDVIRLKAAALASAALREEQREFTFSISHDLKAPANTLKALLRELAARRDCEADPDSGELLDHGAKTVERMCTLIDNVLSYIQTLGNEVRIEPVGLNALVGDILGDLQADIAAAGAAVTVGALPVVTGNPMQLRVLLQNLIANAIKFRTAGAAPAVRITGAADTDGRSARVTVADNGIGISAENHNRIFELFQRLHVHDDYPGTGLGLALCVRIARNHGGHIELTSVPGQGAAFTVHLQGAPA